MKDHLATATDAFVDDLDMSEAPDPFESEADRFARDILIPKRAWDESDARHHPTRESILVLANQLRVHPAIVAGRVRRETKRFHAFNNMVGHREIRALFKDEWDE